MFAEEKTAEFITAIGSSKKSRKVGIYYCDLDKWEIKECITAMEYLR